VELGPKDVIFRIRELDGEGGLIGELRVSRGALVWRGRKDKFGRKLTWRRFDEVMQEYGRRDELRSSSRPRD
jgi:hypothetical protein